MCICVCIYVSVYLFLCCKELAHDFRGWQVPGLVVGKLETQESCWCSSSLKGNRFETQEKLLILFVSKGRENLMSQLKAVKTGGLPSYHRKVILFSLFRPSTDWVRPTHIRAGNLLC